MTTLADKSLLSGGDNKPPMLEKHLYDSWKSRMELYMLNRPHGRMILASVEKGPLVWPSITVDGATRLKEYIELTPAEAIQADCDIKAINIILQGLPTEIYALVSQHRVAKDLWEKIKLLMQGTSLTKQERECKLYDEFDKFTYKKGESLHEYYLRFTLLLNDMNIYKMPLEQFQVNTKFLNTLPDEWSKFVTDVKLVKDLHTTNVDQLHAYLQQHKRHANEVRLMHERNFDPLALVASYQLTQSAYQSHLHTYPNSQLQHHASPYQSSHILQPTIAKDPASTLVNKIPTKMVKSHFEPVQGRQTTYAAGTTRKYTPGASGSNTGKQRTREEISILAIQDCPDIQTSQNCTSPQCCYQEPMDLYAYDSDCDELNSAKMLSWQISPGMAQCTHLRYKEEVKDLKEMQNVENSFSGSNELYAEIVRLKETLFEQKIVSPKPKLYDGNVILKMDTVVIPDSDETLMRCEESRAKNAFMKEQDLLVVNIE
ncbi:hypothetical protein Tco_0801565 [Tanacetum coccineum]|uniref:Integrase, catalytic region, zinc finger, CCHC-type, peptidase aspartic, catalytic n=1 Tax=Tanacetum coccineum TaxID=301880 RepID=A0ABQ4ZZV1_9ASTR